ncbi:MAG: helix-turn-helix domain-containing protein [Parachlamydia sp.]|nr:helix-turn-helix domain-containing protein [Parachlamydia sp.]
MGEVEASPQFTHFTTRGKLVQHYFNLIPTFISSDPSLLDSEKIFYGTIYSLMNKYGFCWASNAYLAKLCNKKPRRIQEMISKFKRLGLIIVEIEYGNERKIWTPETWSRRDEIKKTFDADQEIQSKILYPRTGVHTPMHWSAPNKINDIYISKEKVGIGNNAVAVEARKAPQPTSSQKIKRTQPKPLEPPPKKPRVIAELTRQEEEQLLARMGRDNFEKYYSNARKSIAKYPNGFKDKTLFDIIWEFYSEDNQKKLDRKQTKTTKEPQSTTPPDMEKRTRRKRIMEKFVKENPDASQGVSVSDYSVYLINDKGVNSVDYGEDGFFAIVERFVRGNGRNKDIDLSDWSDSYEEHA